MSGALQRLAVLDDFGGTVPRIGPWARLPPALRVDSFRDHLDDPEALAARLAPYDAVVLIRERTAFPRALIEQLPRLRLVVTTGMRNRTLDLEACAEHGITVCGTPSLEMPTVELTWALILALARQVAREDQALRAGMWQTVMGVSLEGKTLGVIGLGKLGSRVARIAPAFGMRVLAWSPNLTAERAAAAGATRAEKDALLRDSDVVTLHLVLSARTRGVIGAAELAMMKPDALLVNAARGALVDEAALLAALRAERIGGAAIDTYEQEPLPPGHPLTDLPNTVLTPHLGYVTRDNFETYFSGAVEAVLSYLRGAPVRVLR